MPRLRFPVGRAAYEWFNSPIIDVPTDIFLPSVPLPQAVKWGWRVRDWSVSVSGQMKIYDVAHPTTSGNLYTFGPYTGVIAARTTNNTGIPADERGLMTAQILTQFNDLVPTTVVGAPYTGMPAITTPSNVRFCVLGSGTAHNDPCTPDPLIQGNVLANCSMTLDAGSSWFLGNLPPSSYVGGFGTTTGTATLDGVTIQIVAVSGNLTQTGVQLIGFTFSATPTGFWTYGGIGGADPIYDAVTGAILQPYGKPTG
jgi:hypothetical protein